jgi:hypothetical protein
MSLIINNILNPIDVGTISPGNLGLFAGPGDVFYAKKSDGSTYPVTSTVSGFNTGLIFNTFSYVLSITDGNSTQTASLIDLASGYYNAFLAVSTASNVLTLIDGYSTLTASLAYYAGGFNTGMSYNTASNVLSITDGNNTISATLSLTGANTSFTFNPFNNVLSIVDGFGTKTASVALLSGNTGMSFSNGILSLQDGRGTQTASLTSFVKIGELSYTTINAGGTNSTFTLSSLGSVPSNSKIVSIYGKVNQAFVSPTAQITGYAFYAVPGGTTITTFDYTNFSNAFGPNDPFLAGGNDNLELFAMTQSYFQSSVLELISSTSSLTYSVYLSYSDGSSGVLNPQDWTAGNVSFVVEYQRINLSSLPF